MFGMGFMEIFLVGVVAIIALGPDKLPSAMVDIAKMFKKLKGGLNDAKSTLDEELNISQMKEEANKFKSQFDDTKKSMKFEKNLGFGEVSMLDDDLSLKGIIDDDLEDEEEVTPAPKAKKKKKKSTKKIDKPENKEIPIEAENSATDKFKVSFEDDTKSETV